MSASDSRSQVVNSIYAPGYVVLEKYVLERLLGEGGMGSVWQAHNTALDSPVAIKLVRTDLNRDTLAGRLLQEARSAAKLSHPAIVRVFDVGQTELGDPFIVMELLKGESLAATLFAAGRLNGVQAVQTLLPIADALSLAHAKGIVHRDVKPDNVFIVNDQEQVQPKLFDFGIVKVEQIAGNSQLTQVGAVLGSPEYMSPEQARGLEELGHRTDIWSFSVMLYEAISGQPPFQSESYNALLRMIVEDTAPSLDELGFADSTLAAIIARGMEKDPALRWSSMNQLGRALGGWLLDQGITEDICGISVEAKWLMRSTDPNAHPAARATRSSFPDGFLEPRSGVRPSTWRNAQTIAAPEAPPSRRLALRVTVAAISVGLAALAGLAMFKGVRSNPTPGMFAPSAVPAPRAVASATPVLPPTSAPSAASLAIGLDESQPARVVASPPPRAVRSISANAKATKKKKSDTAATDSPAPTKPQDDLLAPY